MLNQLAGQLGEEQVPQAPQPPAQPTEPTQPAPPEPTKKYTAEEVAEMIKRDMANGTLQMEKGSLAAGVYAGLSVCFLCGKEQKTWTDKPCVVTQHVCNACEAKMQGMTKAEQKRFYQSGVKQGYLKVAKAKLLAQQSVFEQQRQEQEQAQGNIGDLPFKVTG